MTTPHKCPVCKGLGKRSTAINIDKPDTTGRVLETCPACKGACVVWEPKAPPAPPLVPTPFPYPWTSWAHPPGYFTTTTTTTPAQKATA